MPLALQQVTLYASLADPSTHTHKNNDFNSFLDSLALPKYLRLHSKIKQLFRIVLIVGSWLPIVEFTDKISHAFAFSLTDNRVKM
jgi:hypothetical protein